MTEIREAEVKDCKDIARIIVQAWQTAYEGIIPEDYVHALNRDRYVDIMEKNITKRLEKILIAERDGRSVGFISGRKLTGDYDCETVGLYIDPAYQRLGAGRKLLCSMMAYFKNQNLNRMIIWTLLGAANNAFYERMGGKIIERKELSIGAGNYAGVGFSFDLDQSFSTVS